MVQAEHGERASSAAEDGRQLVFGDATMAVIAYLTLVAITSILWRRPMWLFLAQVILAGLLLLRWHAPSDIVVFVGVGLLGTAADFAIMRSGAWHFAGDWDVPLWLPLAWASVGIMIARVSTVI